MLKNHKMRVFVWLSWLSWTGMFFFFSQIAIADNEQSSLDSIWSDTANTGQVKKQATVFSGQPAAPVVNEQAHDNTVQMAELKDNKALTEPNDDKADSATTRQDVEKNDSQKQASSDLKSQTGSNALSAPLCSLKSFEQSDFIKNGGGWPDIGPFQRSDNEPNWLHDPQKNRIKLTLSGDKIIEAKLDLVRQPGRLLSIQVVTDFFLEALGAKPKKISEFNVEMEKKKDEITQALTPVDLSAGTYIVSVGHSVNASLNDTTLFIRVSSKDVSQNAIKEHSLPTSTAFQPDVSPQLHQKDSGQSDTGKETVDKGGKKLSSGEAALSKAHPSAKETESETTQAEKRQEFEDLIKSWQQVKKVAVKQREVSELSRVLSGKALKRQSDAVRWLAANHKYYEMSPKGVSVHHIKELAPGQKFAVYAKVHEESKLMDEDTKQMLKESEDTYNVNYTVEKIGGRFLITDSAIMPSNTSPNKLSTSNKSSR